MVFSVGGAKFTFPGCAFAILSRSSRLFTPMPGFTATMNGPVARIATGVTSVSMLYCGFL